MAKQITEFIRDVVKPRFWDNIHSIFPDMNFELKKGNLVSLKHYDGEDKQHSNTEPNTIIYGDGRHSPYILYDYAKLGNTGIDFIELFKQRHNITETWEAVDRLCEVMNIPERPEYSREQLQKYESYKERKDKLEQSLERQKAALFSPDGAATLNYLKSRNWTEEEIKLAELGHISRTEAELIHTDKGNNAVIGGGKYSLSIPSRKGSSLDGFKFRDITWTQASTNPKYLFLEDTDKSHLTYLPALQQKEGKITIVEGELDALRAKVNGVENVVATAGGSLSASMLEQAVQRGFTDIVLLLDKDSSGEQFIRDSIDIAFGKGVSIFVAVFPDEALPDGSKVKDTDDYLSIHSGAELQALIDNAEYGAAYLVRYHIIETLSLPSVQNDLSKITDLQYSQLKRKLVADINNTNDESSRLKAIQTYSEVFGDGSVKEAIVAEADRKRAEAEKLKEQRVAEIILAEAIALKDKGDIPASLAKMAEADRVVKQYSGENYSRLLEIDTEEALTKRMQEKTPALETCYHFKSRDGHNNETLTLPSGAITFIVAATGHGKSTFLQNLAIQTAQSKEEGAVLFFTFEEDRDMVDIKLLNKYMNLELCAASIDDSHSNNIDALTHYYRNKEYRDRYIKTAALEQFNKKRAEFYSELYNSGKLRVFYESFYSNELIDAIRALYKQIKIKAVFIDYIQYIYKKGCKLQRTEEIKEICTDLKDLCLETQLPIIVAAQSNRKVVSPLDMQNNKIADAADLERIANKIVFLWNSAFDAENSKDSLATTAAINELKSKLGFNLGERGQIYALITKNRDGAAPLESVFNYNGNTGVITQGEMKPAQTQGTDKVMRLAPPEN